MKAITLMTMAGVLTWLAAGCKTTTVVEHKADFPVMVAPTNNLPGSSFAHRGVGPGAPLPAFDTRNTAVQGYIQDGRNLEPNHKSKQGVFRLFEKLSQNIFGQGGVRGVAWRTSDQMVSVEHADAVNFYDFRNQNAESAGLGGAQVSRSQGSTSDAGANLSLQNAGGVGMPFRSAEAVASPVVDQSVVQQRIDAMQAELDGLRRTAAVVPAPVVTPVVSAPTTNAINAKLVWKYGGFDGSKAVLDPTVQFSGFVATSSGCTFQAVGDYSGWDLHPSDGAVACVFVQDASGSWGGGKFEWLPLGRKDRSWQNIKKDGYGGWVPPASNSPALFLIASKDGKQMSVPVAFTWQ